MDLSLKHEKLPKDLRERQTPFEHYLLVGGGLDGGLGAAAAAWRALGVAWGCGQPALSTPAAAARAVLQPPPSPALGRDPLSRRPPSPLSTTKGPAAKPPAQSNRPTTAHAAAGEG